jgi:hypothetical protein
VGWRALVAAMSLVGCGAPPPTATRRALGTVEPGVWTAKNIYDVPARLGMTVNWDSKHGQLVLFGGLDRTTWYGDTYLGHSLGWNQPCSTCTAPSPRAFHAAAFDVARGVLVLYGGSNNGTVYNDTWEWNGPAWTQRCTGCAPGARHMSAMAWDPVRGHVILFGGGSIFNPQGDTWQWDGTNWTLVTASGPSARWGAASTTDGVRNRVLLFGGADGSTALNDVWEWDGAAWTQLCTSAACMATPPVERQAAGLAFDPIRRRAVLFGGSLTDSSTWEWDGGAWSLTATTGPPPREFLAMTWFPTDERVLLFGGGTNAVGFYDEWEYHARGDGCAAAADCDGLACVDGVCCESSTCGICQRCDGLGASGVCTPVTNADDPDSCTGANTCDATGSCKLQIGQACGDASACASGFCAGGLCCNRACTLACETCNPVGAPGTCVTAPAGTTVAACGAFRCDGASAGCPIRCAADDDCTPGFYCSAGACSTAQPLGAACAADHSCQSGFCVDGVCCDSACTGRCQFCGSGTCAVPVAEDPRGDCAGDPGCAGACQSDGSCAFPGAESACDVCKVCNASGRCNQPPRSGDDARCGAVSCAALATECRTFGDVERRCVDVGLCAQPNDPVACAASVDAPDGTPCSGGVCQQGECRPPVDAGGRAGGKSGGCSIEGAGHAGGGGALVVLLLCLCFFYRRRP